MEPETKGRAPDERKMNPSRRKKVRQAIEEAKARAKESRLKADKARENSRSPKGLARLSSIFRTSA